LVTTKEENITKLNRAGNLTNGLENESKRWAESIVQLSKDKENMVGNIVLAAGYISYVGCFT
jgi:dynein heavy chain